MKTKEKNTFAVCTHDKSNYQRFFSTQNPVCIKGACIGSLFELPSLLRVSALSHNSLHDSMVEMNYGLVKAIPEETTRWQSRLGEQRLCRQVPAAAKFPQGVVRSSARFSPATDEGCQTWSTNPLHQTCLHREANFFRHARSEFNL